MRVRRLDENHDMTFGHGAADYLTKDKAIAQAVETRLLLLRGEWFLDVSEGVPYLQEIMTKPAQYALTESVIKQRILETEGVTSIESFSMSFDAQTRGLTIVASIKTIYGASQITQVIT